MAVQGYCSVDGRVCQKFPVMIGEIGSRMRDCRNPCNNRKPNCMAMEMQVASEFETPSVMPFIKPAYIPVM